MGYSVPDDDLALSDFALSDDVTAALAIVRRLTGGERASLMLPVAATPELRVVATAGQAIDRLINKRVRLGAPVAGIVAETGNSLLINDEQEFAAAVGRQPFGARGAAFISVPVPLDPSRRGVLNIADPAGRVKFQRSDLTAAQEIATMIGRMSFLRAQLADERAALTDLRGELLSVQESERRRLARDLHDEAGHALTLAVFKLDLERIRPTITDDTKAILARVRDAVMDCATALNNIAFRLRPRILEDIGLVSALRVLITQVQGANRTRVSLDINGHARPLPEEVELIAFRVVQEGLTNIRKHADAANAWVMVSFNAASLEITVCDDGARVSDTEVKGNRHSSQGLRGMRERAESIGGRLTFSRTQSGVTRLSVYLPH